MISLGLDVLTTFVQLADRNTTRSVFNGQSLQQKENIVKYVDIDSMVETIVELRSALFNAEWREGDSVKIIEGNHKNACG